MMVTSDHIIVMKRVGIAELKARLSEHLRAVRRGREVIVVDRREPVARIVPFREEALALPSRAPLRGLHERPLPGPLANPVDSLAALLEERRDRQ